MNWYKTTKQASWGHEDTLEGQHMDRFYRGVRDDVLALRKSAYQGGPEDVLLRWKGELRRHIFMLPPEEKMRRMSMYELRTLKDRVSEIQKQMNRYSEKRFTEIFNANHSS